MVLQPDDCAACDGSGLNRLGRCNVCKGTGKQPEGVEVNDDDTYVAGETGVVMHDERPPEHAQSTEDADLATVEQYGGIGDHDADIEDDADSEQPSGA